MKDIQRCDGVIGHVALSIDAVPVSTSSLNPRSVTSTIIFPCDNPVKGKVTVGLALTVLVAELAAITKGDCSSALIETEVLNGTARLEKVAKPFPYASMSTSAKPSPM